MLLTGISTRCDNQNFGMNFDSNIKKEFNRIARRIRAGIESSTDSIIQSVWSSEHDTYIRSKYLLENYTPYSTLCMKPDADLYIRTPNKEKVILQGINEISVQVLKRIAQLFKAIKAFDIKQIKFSSITPSSIRINVPSSQTETLIFHDNRGNEISNFNLLTYIFRELQRDLST